MVADHLSKLEQGEDEDDLDVTIMETFPDEQLFILDTSNIPWYADFVNFLFHNVYPPGLSWQQKKKCLADVKHYYWDESFLYKLCPDQIL